MQDHFGALHHVNARDFRDVDLAAGNHGDTAEFSIRHRKDLVHGMALEIGIHEIMGRRKGRGIDAPVAQDDVAARADQEAVLK